MSITEPGLDVGGVERATRFAIARAKRRGDGGVTPDDLLAGALHAAARFGVVTIGAWVLDLDELGEEAIDETDAVGPRVIYTPEAAAIFDRAAAIARRDRARSVDLVHLLVAFAGEESGLMGRLKSRYGIDGTHWRAALAAWPRADEETASGTAALSGSPGGVRELLSPEEAAEFLGVHTQTVRGYLRSGKLRAFRLAGERVLRIRKQDLLALLEPYDSE